MQKERTKHKRKKENKKKNKEDYLMRSPSINPDDIEINDQISPKERLAKKNNEEEDH